MRSCLAIFVLIGAAAGRADTLTLRDGQVVKGTYMGGTERTIKMRVDDATRSFDVSDVSKLEFTPPAPIASSPTSSQAGRAAQKAFAASQPTGRI
jgi:hypothetical protein